MTTRTQNGTALSPSLDGWRTRLHTITCPSGQRLRIRIPGVETILEHGDLPDALVDLALAEATRDDGAAGAIAEQLPKLDQQAKIQKLAEFGAFQRELVRAAIVEVEQDDEWVPVSLSADDLRGLPDADVELVAMIVLRLRSTDARGVTIGVEPIDRWARFHETHGLDHSRCEACQAFVDELSSADVGAM